MSADLSSPAVPVGRPRASDRRLGFTLCTLGAVLLIIAVIAWCL